MRNRATGTSSAPRDTSGMVLTLEAGGERRVLTGVELEQALATLGTQENGFATLSRGSGFFQAAGTVAKGFVVEYRDGDDDPQWQSVRDDLSHAEVVALFVSYFHGTGDWKRSVEWRRLDHPVDVDGDAPTWAFTRWLKRILLLLGIGLLCAALWAGVRAHDVSAHLGYARGELVSSRRCGKGGRDLCVTVRCTIDGVARMVQSEVAKSVVQDRRAVPVVFDTRDPASAWVGGPERVWHLCHGLALVGGLIVIISGASALKGKWIAYRAARAPRAQRRR